MEWAKTETERTDGGRGFGGEDAVRPQRAERSEGAIMIQDFAEKKSELSGIMTTFPNLAAKCPRPPPRRGRGLPFQPENSTALIHEKHSVSESAECCAQKVIALSKRVYRMRLQIVGVVHFLFLAQFYDQILYIL
jgi:hypothetical protein